MIENIDNISKKVSVCLSAFNEESTIKELVLRILDVLPKCEIVLTHGGNDKTADLIEELSAKLNNPNIRVIRNLNDRGAGHGLITSIINCSRDIIVNIDSDIQFQPEGIPALLDPILNNKAEIVFGSRFQEVSDSSDYTSNVLRDYGNMIIAKIVSILTKKKFTDISAGFKAWTRNAIMNTGFEDEHYCSFPENAIRAVKAGFDIVEIPILNYADRTKGYSIHKTKFGLIIGGANFIYKSFRTSILLYFNPNNKPFWLQYIDVNPSNNKAIKYI